MLGDVEPLTIRITSSNGEHDPLTFKTYNSNSVFVILLNPR